MKITQVEAIPFAIPYGKPLRFASGEVHVADGFKGVWFEDPDGNILHVNGR